MHSDICKNISIIESCAKLNNLQNITVLVEQIKYELTQFSFQNLLDVEQKLISQNQINSIEHHLLMSLMAVVECIHDTNSSTLLVMNADTEIRLEYINSISPKP